VIFGSKKRDWNGFFLGCSSKSAGELEKSTLVQAFVAHGNVRAVWRKSWRLFTREQRAEKERTGRNGGTRWRVLAHAECAYSPRVLGESRNEKANLRTGWPKSWWWSVAFRQTLIP
jgi:hypothetical protein